MLLTMDEEAEAQTPKSKDATPMNAPEKEREIRFAAASETRRAGARVMKRYGNVFKRLAE